MACIISQLCCCCNVGEYIVLYQKQRESLKKKSEQKDRFITQLIGEKETLQVSVLSCGLCAYVCVRVACVHMCV